MSVLTSLTVMQRFLAVTLAGEAAIITAIGGAARIKPNFSLDATTRHLVYEDYGGVEVLKNIGGPVGMVTMNWALTAWEPGPSQQALEPLMDAVMTVLIGSDTRGRTHRYIDGERVWAITVDYAGPDKVPIEVAPAGVWAPVREVYRLSLQQVP